VSFLSDYNNRPEAAIAGHLKAIKKALEKEIDGTVDTIFGGSVAKHTYVDGLSDVDALVRLKDDTLQSMSPDEVLAYFGERLEKRFPGADVEVGSVAVTVTFADSQIQLVPAVTRKRSLRVPDGDGGWSTARPDVFARALTRANKEQNGKLVPTIKLAKAMLADMPSRIRPSGYHLEALAIEAFKNYNGKAGYAPMLEHFMKESARMVTTPMKDKTGQTPYVDAYLGKLRSTERLILANTLSRVAREMRVADMSHSINDWRRILEAQLD